MKTPVPTEDSTRRLTVLEWLETLAVRAIWHGAGALPLDYASALGGFIARTVGPSLPVTRRARQQMRRALPALTRPQEDRAIKSMWDNLGRTLAEYPHLPHLKIFAPDTIIDCVGMNHVADALALGKPIIFFSGHFGNWEMSSICAVQFGCDVVQVYRAANNPGVEAILAAFRRALHVEPVKKGAAVPRILAAMKHNKALALLVDQKLNDGIAVPFFGRPAMTAPAVAELGLRYDATILPARIDRLGSSARFRLTVYPPMDHPDTGDKQGDILRLMTAINQQMEDWIRADPGCWFWLHRRWPKA